MDEDLYDYRILKWEKVTSRDLTYNTVYYYTPDNKPPVLCIATAIKERDEEDGGFMYICNSGCHITDVWCDDGYELFIERKYKVVKHCHSFLEAVQTYQQIYGSGQEMLMKL